MDVQYKCLFKYNYIGALFTLWNLYLLCFDNNAGTIDSILTEDSRKCSVAVSHANMLKALRLISHNMNKNHKNR